ncbi:hypothetical protein FRB90_008752 [Tulasnella sp. 427]|nr:hypothetical protein FRB90_008752 [Tulasnella sp. 427]
MHITDLPADCILEIIRHLRILDIRSLIQTCKPFASLRYTYLKPALEALRIASRYHLGSDVLALPPLGAAVRTTASLPHKFEEAILSGSLASDSLQRYETTEPGEAVYNAKVFPGGRWLVTASADEESVEDLGIFSSTTPDMIYRVWDLENAPKDQLMEPVASEWFPSDDCSLSGKMCLRKEEDDELYHVWVYSRQKMRELVFDPSDCSFFEDRSIEVDVLDISSEMGLHGNYVFDYDDDEQQFELCDWKMNVRGTFQLDDDISVHSLRWFLTVSHNGLVILDRYTQSLLYYEPSTPQWGFNEGTEEAGEPDFQPYLKKVQVMPITGLPPIKENYYYPIPAVNRPYRTGEGSTALVKFSDSLVYLSLRDKKSTEQLEQSITIRTVHNWMEPTPSLHAETISGHVVAISSPFNVHLLQEGGKVITRRLDYDLENQDSKVSPFVCPIGGILGATHRMDEIWLWRALDQPSF